MPRTLSLDLSAEQLAYLWRVITNDVADASALIRANSFSQYAPADSERVHNNVRIGATLLGQLPMPACKPNDQE